MTEFDLYPGNQTPYLILNAIADKNTELRKLTAWDSGAGATVVNDDRMLWDFRATKIRINGIGPTPVFTDGVGMTIFGRAFLIRESPMSLISQTSVADQNIDFILANDEYVVPPQGNIRSEIVFSRVTDRRLYTVASSAIINITDLADKRSGHDADNMELIMVAIPSPEYRIEAARLHVATGHENDRYLIHCLEKGLITHTLTNIEKLKAAIRYNSRVCKCFACQLGKSVHNNPNAHYVRATTPGTLCADQVFTLLHLDRVLHHITIDEATGMIDIHDLAHNSAAQLNEVHKQLRQQWELRGVTALKIKYDACKIVESMKTYTQRIPISQAQPGQHQVIVEATIGTIREKIRTVTAALNFQPSTTMQKYLLKWVIRTMNISYNKTIDDIPMHKLNPEWRLNASTDLTVGFGDLIMAQIQRSDRHGNEKYEYAKHPCLVMGAEMDGSGTITIYSLFTKSFYFSSGLQNAFKFIPWSFDLEKVVRYVIWSMNDPHITDAEQIFQKIPEEWVMDPDYFNNIPDTILRQRTVTSLQKLTEAAEKPHLSFEHALEVMRGSMVPDLAKAIDEHVALTKIAHEKRMAKAKKQPTNNQLTEMELDGVLRGQTFANPVSHSSLEEVHATGGSDTHEETSAGPGNSYPPKEDLEFGEPDATYLAPPTTSTLPHGQTIDELVSHSSLEDVHATGGSDTRERNPKTTKSVRIAEFDKGDIAKPPPTKGRRMTKTSMAASASALPVPASLPAPKKNAKRKPNTTAAFAAMPSDIADDVPATISPESIQGFLDSIYDGMMDKFDSLMVLLAKPNEADPELAKQQILESRLKELRTLIGKKTIRPIHHTEITAVEMQKRLLTKLFTIFKKNAYKSRAVAGGMGRPQQREKEVDSASPTGLFESARIGLRVAVEEQRDVSLIDFTAAFLNADLPPQISNGVEFRRILEITPDLVQLILQVEPSWKEFICEGRGKTGNSGKGSMYFIIDKALYGMIESSMAWFRELSSTLIAMGFTPSETDPCVFHSYANGDRTSIVVYVDDLLLLARDRAKTLQIRQQLIDKYENITTKDFESSDELNYLNINIKRNVNEDGKTISFELHQSTYCNKMIDELGLRDKESPFESTQLPYTTDLFKVNPDSSPLKKEDAAWYMSAVGKILYTSTKIRIALALPVSFLCKRMQHPTEEDMEKLLRTLHWIKQYPDGGITIRGGSDMNLYVWADASDNCHFDAKGHTGVYISIGKEDGSPVFYLSKVQSLVSRSSTEAELIAVYQSIPHALWAMDALSEWGYVQEKITLYQDNISTIISSIDGSKPYSKTGHINRRIFNSREYLLSGVIVMPHCRTENMLADPLTKPMTPGIALPHIRTMAGLTSTIHNMHILDDQDDFNSDDDDDKMGVYTMAVLDDSYIISEKDIVSQIQVNMFLNLSQSDQFKGACGELW